MWRMLNHRSLRGLAARTEEQEGTKSTGFSVLTALEEEPTPRALQEGNSFLARRPARRWVGPRDCLGGGMALMEG